jgi:hypothetical protein
LAALILVCLTAGVGALIGWFTLPHLLTPPTPKHTVLTLLHVSPNPQPNLFQNRKNRGDVLAFQQTQVALVKSRLVLNAALSQPKVRALAVIREQPDPAAWLEKQVKADFSISPEIMRIFMVGDNPSELTVLVQAVTDAYLKEIVEQEHNKRREHIEKLREIQNKFEDILQSRKKQLKELVINLGNRGAFVDQQKAAVALRADLEKQILQINKELRDLGIELRFQKQRKGIPPAVLEQLVQQDPIIVPLNKELAQLEKEIPELLDLVKKGEREPKVQKLRAKAKTIQEAIKKRRQELEPKLIEGARLKVDLDLQSAIARLQERIALHEQLQDALKQMKQEIENMNAGGFDLNQLQDAIKRLGKIAQQAPDRALALEVELLAPPRIRLLQGPVVLRAQPGQ